MQAQGYTGAALAVFAAVAASTAAAPAQAQFVTLDRVDETSQLGFSQDVDFAIRNRSGEGGDVLWLRSEIYGQVNFGGFGIFAAFPFTHAIGDAGFTSVKETAAGNLEAGLYYAGGGGVAQGIFRVSGVFPTAEADSAFGVPLGRRAVMGRLTDLVQGEIDAGGLRVSGSLKLDFDVIILRVDAGVDFLFPTPSNASDAVPVFFRVNAGLMVNVPFVQPAIELVNLARIDDAGDIAPGRVVNTLSQDQRWVHALAGSLTVKLDPVYPYLAFITSLDNPFVNDRLLFHGGVRVQFEL